MRKRRSNSSPKKRRKKGSSKNGLENCSPPSPFRVEEMFTTDARAAFATAMKVSLDGIPAVGTAVATGVGAGAGAATAAGGVDGSGGGACSCEQPITSSKAAESPRSRSLGSSSRCERYVAKHLCRDMRFSFLIRTCGRYVSL